MKLTMYQIDAFANQVFSGNPAAVCFLQTWLFARQLSNRGGNIKCECIENRVYLSGTCAEYMKAEIEISGL